MWELILFFVGVVFQLGGVALTIAGARTVWKGIKAPDDRFLAPFMKAGRLALRLARRLGIALGMPGRAQVIKVDIVDIGTAVDRVTVTQAFAPLPGGLTTPSLPFARSTSVYGRSRLWPIARRRALSSELGKLSRTWRLSSSASRARDERGPSKIVDGRSSAYVLRRTDSSCSRSERLCRPLGRTWVSMYHGGASRGAAGPPRLRPRLSGGELISGHTLGHELRCTSAGDARSGACWSCVERGRRACRRGRPNYGSEGSSSLSGRARVKLALTSMNGRG